MTETWIPTAKRLRSARSGRVGRLLPASKTAFFLSRIHHMWCIAAILLAYLMLGGCGLPDYTVLPEPSPLDSGYGTILGFQTPSPNAGTEITGFALYYKVYSDEPDFNTEDDERYFDPSDYPNSLGTSIQPGDYVMDRRDFVYAGIAGSSSLPALYNIPAAGLTLGTDNILIDFDEGEEKIDPKNRPEPVFGTGAFPIVDPDNAVSGVIDVLARGFKDYRQPDDTLRAYVDDWAFSNDDVNGFFDGDLRRPPGTQPGEDASDLTGTPINGFIATSINKVFIAFAVYSVGVTTTAPITQISSIPVYLGRVDYNALMTSSR